MLCVLLPLLVDDSADVSTMGYVMCTVALEPPRPETDLDAFGDGVVFPSRIEKFAA